MKVLVDTCVWSLALRRNQVMESPYVLELRDLITEFRVQMMGPVRQELALRCALPDAVQDAAESFSGVSRSGVGLRGF